MHLILADVAKALNVDEKAVLRLIKKERLPAERVGGEFQINRVDLLEWATDKGLKVDPALYKAQDDDTKPLPSLSQALEAGGIHCHVAGTDKETVLRSVVALLDLPAELDPEFVLQVLLSREALGTTAVGDGIAIPHVRNPILLQLPVPKVALCFLAQPIDFDALDGIPVHILFTLTSPTVRMHLHLLSKLAYALRDERLREALRTPCDQQMIISVLKSIEHDIGRPSK
jgi:PTS system nitrogen regulatory IIA component